MPKNKVKVIEVTTVDELPTRYILFPDNLEAALERLDQLQEKLYKRGLKVAEPVVAFRRTFKEKANKTGRVIKPSKPYAELAFRLEKL